MRRARFVLALLLLTLVPAAQASAGVNDFIISDYKIDYILGKDTEGRSTLKTTETITAQFPSYDQNHGIERAIPKSYQGHTVSLEIQSVTNGSGVDWNYTTYTSNDNLLLRIGDADRYVHGAQTYTIVYTQRDVTNYFGDTADDEFYWDTNGTEWAVPIQRLVVTLRLDSDIANQLNDKAACYVGVAGVDDSCQLTREGDTFTTAAEGLTAGENVTVAIGFNPGTFQPYQPTTWEKLFPYILAGWFALWVVGFGLIIYVSKKFTDVVNRRKELTVFPPEYLPPADTSVTTAATVVERPRAVFAAQLLDFAVRHYLKLYEIEKKVFLGFDKKDYEIEIVRDTADLKAEEQEILRDIFGGETAVGTRLKLSSLKNNTTVYKRTVDNDKKIKALVRGEYGLRTKNAPWAKRFRMWSLVLFLLGVVTLSPFVVVAAGFAFVYSFIVWVLTDKGLELSRYLRGLRQYIEMAEKDRLQALQSPEGVEKVGQRVDVADSAQLVKLYERVLPYAVLFGQEKEWNKQIGQLYEATSSQPDWYSGRTAFNAAAFGTAMHSFSSAASYSSASSSSSGGSSGGGSSGGGGGGGGGGGW